MPELNFWLNQFTVYATLYLISYVNGEWVKRTGVKVNYTRKINHFALFLAIPLTSELIPYEQSVATMLTGMLLTLVALSLYAEPIRRRVPLVATMFLSFDRPEDRPFTLLWLITQFLASYLVLIPLIFYLYSIDRSFLIYIPILINGIGDGLAEPVGVRFGKHSYPTRALFTRRKYQRTLEGSACVLATGVVSILLFASQFTVAELWVMLLVIPLLMTLAEAWSPHTWDSPFLYLVGGLALIGIDRIFAA